MHDLTRDGKRDDSFYFNDIQSVRDRIDLFKRLMPRVNIFYAMKANADESLCKACIDKEIGFDVASETEIVQSIKLGA